MTTRLVHLLTIIRRDLPYSVLEVFHSCVREHGLPVESLSVLIMPFRIYVGTCSVTSGISSIIVRMVPSLAVIYSTRTRTLLRRELLKNGIISVIFPEDLTRCVLALSQNLSLVFLRVDDDLVYGFYRSGDVLPHIVDVLDRAVTHLEKMISVAATVL